MLIKWLYLYFAWVYKQWGKTTVDTQAKKITSVKVIFPIAFNTSPYTIQITLNDSALTESGLERPIGFIDNSSTNKKEFVLKNFSEITSGTNAYYWFSVGA